MKLPIKIKGLMNPGTETKIVAVLLLFFLAHVAFSETPECGMFEKAVSYYCGFVTPRNIILPDPQNSKKTISEHHLWWGSTPEARSVCMKTDYFTRGTFDHKITKTFHVKEKNLIPYDPTTLRAAYGGRESSDLVVGIRLIAEPSETYGLKYRARIFIHRLGAAKNKGAVTYSSPSYDDFPEAPTVDIEGTYGATSVTLNDGTSLACGFQIGTLPPGS